MIFRLTHDGVTRDLDMNTLVMRESIELQNLTGLSGPEWVEALTRSRAEAITFAWFLACKRHGDEVSFTELLDTLDQMKLDVELIPDEEPADKPAELGVIDDEGPTSPAKTAGETSRRKTRSSTGRPSSDMSTE